MGSPGGTLGFNQWCKVITVERDALPDGHDFVIVVQERVPDVLVFAAPDDRAQLEARAAFLAWEGRVLGAFN